MQKSDSDDYARVVQQQDDDADTPKQPEETVPENNNTVPQAMAQGQNLATSNLSVMAVFMLAQFACICYVSMQAILKSVQLTEDISAVEISLIRTASTTVVAAFLHFCIFKESLRVPTDMITPLMFRCIAGAIAFVAVTKVISLIPLTVFQVISQMNPFVSGLIAFVWLGEKLALFQIVAMVFCFGGITIVALSSDQQSESQTGKFSQYELGIFLALIIVLIFAVSAVTTRRIRGIHFSVIQLYLAVIGLLVSAIWLFFYQLNNEIFQFKGGAMTWVKLLLASFFHFGGQMSTTCMNQSINPATAGMFMYIQVVYSYLFDTFIFGTSLDGLQFLGAGIILSFTVAGAVHRRAQAIEEKRQADAVATAKSAADNDDDNYVKKV